MSRLSLLVLASLVSLSLACFSSGVCGGGCGMPPPPPPVCGGGCGRGYACGSYGCARVRARARSSLTLKLAEQKQENLSPDEKFMRCCEDRNLPDSCLGKCSYRTYTRDSLQNMYFKLDACPMQAAADIQYCAAQGRDHTECCERNGVATTLAGGKCLTFCDQRPGNVTQLDMTYIACYDRFDSMKACFWHDAQQNPQPMEAVPAASVDTQPEVAEPQPQTTFGQTDDVFGGFDAPHTAPVARRAKIF